MLTLTCHSNLMKKKLSSKEKEFAKLKRFVSKRAPGAHTIVDSEGNYVVVDEAGEDVVRSWLLLPPAKSVRQAWEQAKYGLWYQKMIAKSNAAFNEEKIYKKLIKESGGE